MSFSTSYSEQGEVGYGSDSLRVASRSMPEVPVYQFIPAPYGQTRTTRELQRAVRSHAASVSRPNLVIRRRAHAPKLSIGESVIAFNTDPAAPTERSEGHGISPPAGAAAHIEDPVLASESDQSDLDPSWRTSKYRLFVDIHSGQTFSPISQLATFRKPYLPGIINHYIYNLTIPTPEIDGSSSSPYFRATWVPIVIHDPLIFQVVVLFAATHFATFADPNYYEHLSQELLCLKQSALSALIRRVQDEQSTLAHNSASSMGERTFNGCSDTLIAASAKMASYEAIFGSVQAFHFHMSAVAQLLRLRADISTLGMGGFLAPLLSFVDINSAFLLGSNMYLGEFGLANYNYMPHHEPFRPMRFDEVTASSSSQTHPSDVGAPNRAVVVNLERFIGSRNIERIQSR